MNNNIQMLLISFLLNMIPTSKLLEQIVFKKRPKIEKHTLYVMEYYTEVENLSHPLHTNNKQFKIGVTFPTDYNGIFSVRQT